MPTFLFMDIKALVKEIEEVVSPLLDKESVELVEILYRREGGKMVLRFLVDVPGGITLAECARLNNEIGKVLDESNMPLANYLLEVSSPGLDRPIKTVKDFLRAVGKKVRLLYSKDGREKVTYIGEVKSVDNEDVTLVMEGKEEVIPIDKIVKARLEIEEI